MSTSIRTSLILIVACAASLQAQPTLSYTDFPTNPGTTINTASDWVLGPVNLGEDGPNRSWNFSSRTAGVVSSQNWVEPSSTPFTAQFPTANRCSDVLEAANEHSYTYFVLNPANITVLGSGVVTPDSSWSTTYSSTQPSYPFPVSYGAQWNTVFRYNLENGTFYDSTHSQVDAWGTVTDLSGNWPCLRIKSHITTVITYFGFPFTTTTWAYSWLVAGRGAQITISSDSNEPNQNFTQGYFSRITDVLSVQSLPDPIVMPTSIELTSAYPNPFNASTVLTFKLPNSGDVNLSIFDAAGRQVRGLAQGHYSAGAYQVTFDGAGLPSGTYFARLMTDRSAVTRSLTLLK
jgi:hypothetical protein